MHQWMSDSGHTPHLIVDAERPGVEVPRAYVKEGKIVLNVSMSATQRLLMSNEQVEFDARFAGVIHHLRFPVTAVLGIYARETGGDGLFRARPRPRAASNIPDNAHRREREQAAPIEIGEVSGPTLRIGILASRVR
jgi:stringent starvation protein B